MNTKIKNIICPRCRGYIPNAKFAGMYPGALSRVDNKTEICSDCGNQEAIENWLEGAPKSKEHWLGIQ